MILVTGATGFLGAELVKQLAGQGITVRCTKRSTSVVPAMLRPYSHLIEWVDADITNLFALEDAMAGVTQVYHCAAWVSFRQKDKDPMIFTNVTGTANVVNACMQAGARLLHVSSVAAVGPSKKGELITEKHHLEDTPADNGYAISKLESEMEVWRGVAEGLNAVIVNPSIIIGAAEGAEGSGKLFERIRKGLKVYTGGSCGFVDVEDVAKSMISLMNSDISGERFIISAENRYFKELVTTVAHKFGVKPPSMEAKPWMLGLGWRAAAFIAAVTGTEPRIDKIAAQSASVVQNYDNIKIRKATGIEFKPLDKSIDEIVAVLKSS